MKLKILTTILAILIIPISLAFAAGFVGKDYYTWYGTTADDVTVAWDHPGFQTGDTFEIQIRNPERNTIVNIPSTSTLNKIFKCPKTGHWIVSVRAKRIVSDQPQYSAWVDSTDPAVSLVNGQPKGWWLFVWIAGTGEINIGKTEEREIIGQTGNHKNTLEFNNLNEMDDFFASINYGGK